MVDTVVRSDQPVRVSGEGFEPRTLQAGEAFTFSSPTPNLTVEPADPADIAPPPITDDVFAPSNRPNGAVTAGVAPKMPKSSGELSQVIENGRIVERAAADIGVATQGGGPESTDGTTPGPQPQPLEVTATSGVGAATGDIDARGRPVARTEEAVQQAPADAPEPGKQAPAPAQRAAPAPAPAPKKK